MITRTIQIPVRSDRTQNILPVRQLVNKFSDVESRWTVYVGDQKTHYTNYNLDDYNFLCWTGFIDQYAKHFHGITIDDCHPSTAYWRGALMTEYPTGAMSGASRRNQVSLMAKMSSFSSAIVRYNSAALFSADRALRILMMILRWVTPHVDGPGLVSTPSSKNHSLVLILAYMQDLYARWRNVLRFFIVYKIL